MINTRERLFMKKLEQHGKNSCKFCRLTIGDIKETTEHQIDCYKTAVLKAQEQKRIMEAI